MLRYVILCLSFLAGCTGLAWDTEVAGTLAARNAMAESVVPGWTTETAFTTRWGKPTQKIREGGQTEFVYRDIKNPPGWLLPQFGNNQDYVIVTFQYGLATAVRTSDGIDCRGTFPPRPPSFDYDNPTTVKLVGTCAPPAWWNGRQRGQSVTEAGYEASGIPEGPPGVIEDRYVPSTSALK